MLQYNNPVCMFPTLSFSLSVWVWILYFRYQLDYGEYNFFYPNALFFSFSFSQGHGPFNRTKSVLRILRVWPGRRHPCRVALAGNYLRQFVVFCNNGWNAIWCSVLFENIFGVIVVLFSNLDFKFRVLVSFIENILSNVCQ